MNKRGVSVLVQRHFMLDRTQESHKEKGCEVGDNQPVGKADREYEDLAVPLAGADLVRCTCLITRKCGLFSLSPSNLGFIIQMIQSCVVDSGAGMMREHVIAVR